MTICSTILLTPLFPWSAEDGGSTVGHNPIHRSISIFPLSLEADGRTEGATAAFPVFAYFLPFLCRPPVRPSVHLSFLLPPSPSPPLHSPLSSPFLRLCTEIRFADPPLNEIPRGRCDVALSPSVHSRLLVLQRPISKAMTNASSNQHGCFQEISSNGRLSPPFPLVIKGW